jgi:AcrR family transcriptional regulator
MSTERRTQAERTDATTAQLLAGTVSALVDLGYRGATTTEIAKRARVSRGAMLHHFPNRAALFAATADWLTDGHIELFEKGLVDVDQDADRLSAAIDLLWAICSSPVHVAWMEFAAAAHHEPELAATITLAGARMRERTRQTWAANFEEFSGESFSITAPDFALSLLEGLALSQRTAPDPAIVTSVVDALKDLSNLLDPTNREFIPNLMSDSEDT